MNLNSKKIKFKVKNKTEINEINKLNDISNIILQKPFLKWLGGKTQIINDILKCFPNIINNYHEICLGGGSVLFAVLSLQKQQKITIRNNIYAYDKNKSLINVYKNIQTNYNELFDYLTEFIKNYNNLSGIIINRKPNNIEEAKTSKESYYYYLRSKFNTLDKNSVEYSALFIFLNKTCYRGVYRESNKTGFNVPFGHYKTTLNIFNKDELVKISDLIKNVEFICADFTESLKNPIYGDYVYIDPPYFPEKETSFVGYTIDGFDLNTHKKLFDDIKKLNDNNIKFSMSNAKVDMVLNIFKDFKYNIIDARRAIKVVKKKNNETGGTTKEIVIYN